MPGGCSRAAGMAGATSIEPPSGQRSCRQRSRAAVDRVIEAYGEEAVAAFAARMRDGDPAELARLRALLTADDL
jgi:hypothetical protein